MKWIFRGDRPIYAQLIEHLERGILTGEYPPGSAVPSVRTLAIEAEVNPNTMQRALAELENRGLLHTHRTAGRSVTENRAMLDEMKNSLARAQVEAFFDGMRAIGIGVGEAAKLISAAAKAPPAPPEPSPAPGPTPAPEPSPAPSPTPAPGPTPTTQTETETKPNKEVV